MLLLLALVLAQSAAPTVRELSSDEKLGQRIETLAREAVEQDGVPGLSILVGRDDQIVFSKGWGYADPRRGLTASADTTYAIGSLTRQFIAVAILALAEEKKLTLDDELARWLSDFPLQGNKVSLRELLANTSGVPGYAALAAKHAAELEHELTREQLFALFKDVPFDFAPGTSFASDNPGYHLLSLVIAKASGEEFTDYVRKHILEPLAFEHTAFCPTGESKPGTGKPGEGKPTAGKAVEGKPVEGKPVEGKPVEGKPVEGKPVEGKPVGGPSAESKLGFAQDCKQLSDKKDHEIAPTPSKLFTPSLCSTVKDLFRWQRALSDRTLIGESSTRAMFTPVREDGPGRKYGFEVALDESPESKIYSHTGGIGGSRVRIAYYATPRLTVIVLANCATAPVERLEKAITVAALDLVPTEIVDLALDPRELALYTGSWQIATERLRTFAKDGKLWYESGGEAAFVLQYQGRHVFVPGIDKERRITFLVEDGKPAESFESVRRGLFSTGKRME